MSTDDDLKSLARAPDAPAFAAPWEATAFALRAHLVGQGVLDANRFAALLGEELAREPAAQDEGTNYFVAFVTALERAVAEGGARAEALAAERQAWRDAAAATPHGLPITLPPNVK
jgi:nitrile hydratase accessory protein